MIINMKVLVLIFIEITSIFLAKVVRMSECCRLHDRGEKEDSVKFVLFSIEHIVIFCAVIFGKVVIWLCYCKGHTQLDCFSLTLTAVHTYKFIYSVYIHVHVCVCVMTYVTSAVPTLKKRFVGASVVLGLTTSPLSIVHFASLSLLEVLAKTISISFR